jgi:anaerobic sulfatase-maturating enzyme
MRCSYCYVFSDEIDNYSRKQSLNISEIENILREYAQYSLNNSKNICDVTWHGGEPLLIGIKKFEEIIDIEKNIFEKMGVFVRNRLQTNATLINDEWCNFFKKYKFSIGVSLDGPKDIFNKNRYYEKNKPAFEDVIKGIKKLEKNNIPFGILSVITNEISQNVKQIYNYFKTIGVKYVDFIPSYLPTTDSYNLSPKNWGIFLCELFDIWIKSPTFHICYFEDIIKKIMNLNNKNNTNLCLMCELGSTCGENLSITSDGKLYFCECLIGLSDYFIDDLKKISLKDALSSENFFRLFKKMNKKIEKCQKCNYYQICESGCLKHRIGHGNEIDYFCEGKQLIFKRILTFLLEGY